MSLGEFDLIARCFRPLATHPASLDLTDDAAVLSEEPGSDLVICKDAIVAGVHFLPSDPPDCVGKKALRTNLSDLAAMGAAPLGYLLALLRPGGIDDAWIERCCQGLAEDQETYGLALLGGDTVSTPGPLALSVTAIGRVPKASALKRGGAGVGDDVWVTGTLGDAALGLKVLRMAFAPPDEADAAFLATRYRLPQPRLDVGRRLQGLATACLDISDGLVQDAGHLATASGVALRLNAADVPLSTAAGPAPGALAAALTGGDDYELLFTAPKTARLNIHAVGKTIGVALTLIGEVQRGAGVTVIGADDMPLDLKDGGWAHRWD